MEYKNNCYFFYFTIPTCFLSIASLHPAILNLAKYIK